MLNISSRKIKPWVDQEKFYSLRSIKTPRAGYYLARIFLVTLLVMIFGLFLPWQQNIRGLGNVTAFSPGNRPQTIETAIPGRISEWKIREGDEVKAGDTILVLAEILERYFDPLLLPRLNQQIEAKQDGLKSKEQKAEALRRQITALRENLRIKLEQNQAILDAAQVRFNNAENQYQRNKTLYEAGNIPLTKFQDFEFRYQNSKAELNNTITDMSRIEAEFIEKISKAESDLNNTLADIFDSYSEIVKMKNEYSNLEIRSQQYYILAPQNGFVVRTIRAGIGETIKEGEAVATIIPQGQINDMAVEMYIKAMDVPIIAAGKKVRLEFDGWPAIVFSGWPSLTVGTFGGEVAVIDRVNARPGEFRILIKPDPDDEPWPELVRVGSGTKGWVMLKTVPIWYEIWRNLNGFPPGLYEGPLEIMLEANPNLK
ncbi:MAG TPA: HlyD family efflux transporter periplasmic adaptor subunit [Cyclobacteriaceae bacterium]|nr:HlyD family efflux transporter periplasmic adaptor subunit [Cyclobacteriaceae bacterium]